jgi:hypothetical protein
MLHLMVMPSIGRITNTGTLQHRITRLAVFSSAETPALRPAFDRKQALDRLAGGMMPKRPERPHNEP